MGELNLCQTIIEAKDSNDLGRRLLQTCLGINSRFIERARGFLQAFLGFPRLIRYHIHHISPRIASKFLRPTVISAQDIGANGGPCFLMIVS